MVFFTSITDASWPGLVDSCIFSIVSGLINSQMRLTNGRMFPDLPHSVIVWDLFSSLWCFTAYCSSLQLQVFWDELLKVGHIDVDGVIQLKGRRCSGWVACHWIDDVYRFDNYFSYIVLSLGLWGDWVNSFLLHHIIYPCIVFTLKYFELLLVLRITPICSIEVRDNSIEGATRLNTFPSSPFLF